MSLPADVFTDPDVCTQPDLIGATGYARGCRCPRCTEGHRTAGAQYRQRSASGVYIREPGYKAFPADLHDNAACRGEDPALFFTDGTGRGSDRKAKQICDGCPVREGCLAWSLEQSGLHGTWGGLNETERRRIRRKAKGW